MEMLDEQAVSHEGNWMKSSTKFETRVINFIAYIETITLTIKIIRISYKLAVSHGDPLLRKFGSGGTSQSKNKIGARNLEHTGVIR
jgi:hypothetical protein